MNLAKRIADKKRKPFKAVYADVDLEVWEKAEKKRIQLEKKLGKKVFWTDIIEELLTDFVKT